MSRPNYDRGELTEPSLAREFVERTSVDALAVAIGTVHGIPRHPVVLDLVLLEGIGSNVQVPLVIHGASGVDDAQLLATVGLGVAKINYNAELRRAYIGALRTALETDRDDVVAIQLAAASAMCAVARDKLALLGGANIAPQLNFRCQEEGPS